MALDEKLPDGRKRAGRTSQPEGLEPPRSRSAAAVAPIDVDVDADPLAMSLGAGADDLDPALIEMVEVFTQRTMAGELVDVEQLVADYPGWSEEFRKLLPTLQGLAALDGAGAGTGVEGAADLGVEEGKVFGEFRIVREIGRGGMGVVYEARQVALGRRVALKVMSPAAIIDPKALRRFQLEAQVAGLLQHSHIVPVHAVGTVNEVPYFAMQLVEGGSMAWLIAELRGLVDRGGDREPDVPPSAGDSPSALALGLLAGHFSPSGRDSDSERDRDRHHPAPAAGHDMPGPKGQQSIGGRGYLRTVARLGIQAAEALGHAHDQGIVHRDIKPANLLLDRHGHLWVADFGMADVQGDAGLTMTGDLPGTLRYMSPEQATDKRALIDRRTDIYSLGATLYELLTLQPAVIGSDRAEIIRRVAEEEPEPIRRLNPAVPVDLSTIVTKALSKDPSRRYETALDLADDLARFLEGRPIAARPVGPLARGWRWCGRKPLLAGLAAALVLALAVGFSGITWQWWKAQAAEKRALTQAAKADAVNRFLIDKLLGQASPHNNPAARGMTLREALDRAAGDVGQSFKQQPEIEAAIRMALGHTYHDLGDYSRSEAHHRAAHDILRNLPGSSAEARLDAMSHHGDLLTHLRRMDEAEKLLLKAVEETRAVLGQGHPVTLTALEHLANLYKARGRFDHAEALNRSLIKECTRYRGSRAPETLRAINNLGTILYGRKKYVEAERLFRQNWMTKLETLGPEAPNTLATLVNLATVLAEMNRVEEAEGIVRKCLETQRRVLGPDHPSTISATSRLGMLLRSRGQFDEAEGLFRTALEAHCRTLGPNHPDTLRTSERLAALLKARDQAGAAKKP